MKKESVRIGKMPGFQWNRISAMAIALMVLLAGSVATTYAQTATAGFTPAKIYLDQTSTYQLTIDGESQPDLSGFKAPAGLSLVGRSEVPRHFEINGRVISESYTLRLAFQAEKPGKYVVPAFESGDIKIPAATLEVLPIDENRQKQLDEAERQRQEAERRQREAQREIIGIDIRLLTDGPIYVGQAVPIEVIAYARSNIYLEILNLPTKDADEFTLEEFPQKPEQQPGVSRDGRSRYNDIVWKNVLTPLKAGSFPIQFKEAFVAGRGFFSRQQIQLSSDEMTIDVLPLPNDGKPADFGGAIGDFLMDPPVLDTTSAKAGEPITMEVKVDGTGNFERMDSPVLRNTEGWRVYPPEGTFKRTGNFENKGIKTYKYVMIPRNESVIETPTVEFSYFNPEAGEYAVLSTKPVQVEISPAPPGSRPIIEPRITAQSRGPVLLPNTTELGATTSTLQPILLNPVFLAGQVLPLGIILGLFFWRKQQLRLQTDVAYTRGLRARREVTRRMQSAAQAAQAGDAATFYLESMRAIQEAVAPSISREPESLTIHEVEAFLYGSQSSDEAVAIARRCFEADEALRFGGMQVGVDDLAHELDALKQLVSNLEGGRK